MTSGENEPRTGDWPLPHRGEHLRYWLVYDGQCPVCRNSVRLLRQLDRQGRIQALDLHTQADRLAERGGAIDADELMATLHLIGPAGEIWRGFEAVRQVARIVPPLRLIATLMALPGAPALGDRLYRWSARNRYRFLPWSCGHACALP